MITIFTNLQNSPQSLLNMSFKYRFCQHTFSRRLTYARHINKYILTAKSSDKSSDGSKEYQCLKSNTTGNTLEYFEDFNKFSNTSSNVYIFSFFIYIF